ncbi:sensor histidine kinase [Spongiactinospora rosea]|nr:HAMP domain-containing sensor histidine kinase [Spongiactinospora rosea]
MTARKAPNGPYRVARRKPDRLRRSTLSAAITAVTGLVGVLAAVLADAPPALAAAAGMAGGGGLAVAGLHGMALTRGGAAADPAESAGQESRRLAALGHELRTPLSMIKGAVDLLGEGSPGPLTEAQRRFVTVLDRQCAQVIRLCESLLTQAKIEAGVFVPRLEETDVSAVTRDVVTAMRPLCAERRQRITLDTPQVTPPISADPMLLAQAVSNLLSNASRFTTVGGAIDVRVLAIDTGIAVYVTDDGAGMTREQRRRLFQRFATGLPLAGGTGLGLVLTKSIVELHGGSIMVDTTSMRGTTFLFTLPATLPG